MGQRMRPPTMSREGPVSSIDEGARGHLSAEGRTALQVHRGLTSWALLGQAHKTRWTVKRILEAGQGRHVCRYSDLWGEARPPCHLELHEWSAASPAQRHWALTLFRPTRRPEGMWAWRPISQSRATCAARGTTSGRGAEDSS